MTGPVLVTGANGFVGQAVCRRLCNEGWRVLAAVRPGRPAPEGCEPRPAPGLAPDADWRPALDGARYVIHAAARVHQMGESLETAEQAHRDANFLGTLALAEQARRNGIQRFVFISTVKVMGEHSRSGRPFSDIDEPGPMDAYARSKWAAEQALLALPGLEVACLRPPLVYGPGATANLKSVMRLVHKGIPLPFGLIRNRRSLIGVTNLAAAAILLLTHPNACGKSFLIKDLDVSTPDLIRLLAGALGCRARLLAAPPRFLNLLARLSGRQGLAERLLGDLAVDDSGLRQTLGWKPVLTPEAELRRMAEAFIRGL